MRKTMMMMTAAGALLAATATHAQWTDNPPAAPVLAFDGCVNWRMNLIWTGATDTILYEIQRKIGHEDDFSPLFSRYHQSENIHYYMDSTFFMYQDTEYRIRALNTAGASPWVTVTGLARNGATGQWIGTPGSYNNYGMTGDKAFDGNVTTYFDAPALNADDAWTGMDFGENKVITGIRFVPRRGLEERMTNGWFEVANDPDFTSPTTLHTVETIPPANVVTEVPLDPPVTARYARYCAPEGAYGNIAELEFVTPPTPIPSTGLTVAASDLTNAYAVLTWSSRDGIASLFSSTLVYRATSPGGPYDCMTPEGLCTECEWTDTTVAPSIRYYYRLTALVNTPSGSIESEPGPYVAYIPYIWIERDPVTLATIKPGMALLGAGNPYATGRDVDQMFDNDLNSYVDMKDRNAVIGVDLAKPYCVAFMRHAARSPYQGRLNGTELRGSNDPDYTNNFTRLATFAGATVGAFVTQQTVNQEPFRYIFLQHPDAGEFYGNINELELYGWDPDVANSIFRAPPSVTISIQPRGIQLDWEQGTQQ
ncbi:MAG: discoidin domain-containing protein, partial [Kiritimatiellaeota bacterium]|nr:discoidin domain-containing protein [Kiritimatiellota bacterium]